MCTIPVSLFPEVILVGLHRAGRHEHAMIIAERLGQSGLRIDWIIENKPIPFNKPDNPVSN